MDHGRKIDRGFPSSVNEIERKVGRQSDPDDSKCTSLFIVMHDRIITKIESNCLNVGKRFIHSHFEYFTHVKYQHPNLASLVSSSTLPSQLTRSTDLQNFEYYIRQPWRLYWNHEI